MTFSAQVKTELCKDGLGKKCCALAEAYGVLLYANCFTAAQVRVMTANDAFAARLPKLFRRAFGLDFDELPPPEKEGKRSFCITDPGKLAAIFAAIGYDASRAVSHHVNLPVVENDCDRVAFLRGAFLAGGSVTDPQRSYHLELSTSHASVCREGRALLLDMGFTPGDGQRGSQYLTYFKRSGVIEDLLTTMGAPVCAMEVMQATVEKHMANAMNRITNCDLANSDKLVAANADQMEAIRAIEAGPGIASLPAALQETALLRIANPACSLAELAQLADPPVTKSCVSHRMRKLTELAKRLAEPPEEE
ncbi:MAG: DNA-binding protein WhiA [Oscillospiraceae bacterium]|nr:DNA-binding protein WhiA [Oscillospiraceae bacterium]